MTPRDSNLQTMLNIFKAVEDRDDQRMLVLCLPNVEFFWPGSLPYSGRSQRVRQQGSGWAETWLPVQPTRAIGTRIKAGKARYPRE